MDLRICFKRPNGIVLLPLSKSMTEAARGSARRAVLAGGRWCQPILIVCRLVQGFHMWGRGSAGSTPDRY